jgi:processing peptidase subunit beta
LGGEKRETNELLSTCHFAIAFETPGISSTDAYTIKLIEQLLGSYSRDKGEAAYSCMTRAVVAEFYDPHSGAFKALDVASHNPVHSLQTFWTAYNDTGLLGFYCVAEPGKPYTHNLEKIISFAMREMVRITQTISDEELQRAKNQLKVQTMLALDGTTTIADDIGRQILTRGHRAPLSEVFDLIDVINKDSLVRCAMNIIFDKDPVAATIGDLRNMPEYEILRRLSYWNSI